MTILTLLDGDIPISNNDMEIMGGANLNPPFQAEQEHWLYMTRPQWWLTSEPP